MTPNQIRHLQITLRKLRCRRNAAVDAALPFFLALLVLFGMAYGGWTWYRVHRNQEERGQAIDEIGPPLPISNFDLTESNGKPFHSADMKGKVWVATYFFTSCPGECIRLNRNIQVMHKMPDLKDVTWVSITCDPDTDNLATLTKYAETMQADPDRWLFCRGDMDYTARVARGMDLFLSRKGHQSYAIVIDKWGNMRGLYNGTSTSDCERLQKKLVELLAEDTPPQSKESATTNHETTTAATHPDHA